MDTPEYLAQLRALLEPSLAAPLLHEAEPFFQYSTCAGLDFLHPRYHAICRQLRINVTWHRKWWEFVFIAHHLQRSGKVRQGARGLGFGVGREPLPALFASLGAEILATDAPDDTGGWVETGQHAKNLDPLRFPEIVSDDEFYRLVSHRPVDMNAVPDDLTGFDFLWSSCCFEHLGSLRRGMDFVRRSMDCLAPGGVGVHTTEFNVSNNEQTLDEGGTVLYRARDLEQLVDELRADGHDAEPFRVSPYGHHLDGHVDLPPYSSPHLKLAFAGYVCTSAGIVVRAAGG